MKDSLSLDPHRQSTSRDRWMHISEPLGAHSSVPTASLPSPPQQPGFSLRATSKSCSVYCAEQQTPTQAARSLPPTKCKEHSFEQNPAGMRGSRGGDYKVTIFWDVTQCNPVDVRRHFRGTNCLCLGSKRGSLLPWSWRQSLPLKL